MNDELKDEFKLINKTPDKNFIKVFRLNIEIF